MRKLLPLSAIVLFAGVLTAQSIPDGGFESWNTITWNDPQNYMTSNDQNVPQGAVANVTQTEGYNGGTYGVMLQTINTSKGVQPGYFINANVGGNGISGGIPYSQNPTGIRFYYQYAPSGIDTAAVLVIFKKAGSTVDSFLVALTSAASSYTLHSYMPSHLPVSIDTVIFGAISSIAGIGGGGGNVGSTLIIDSITFTGVSSQPAELNGNFENWTTSAENTLPGWYISYPNVTRTKDAETGNYAIELTTANSNGGPEVGQASTGYYPNCNGNCNEQGGFPYTLTQDSLEFGYKYAPVNGDTANISLNFIKNGQSVNYAGIFLSSVTSAYKDTFLTFNLGAAPDSVIITIQSSWHNNNNNNNNNSQYAMYVGSTLEIDNLTFTSQKISTGINKLNNAAEIKVFPNPATSQISVDLTNVPGSGSVEKLVMYDMSGRILSVQTCAGNIGNTIKTIDMSGLSTGLYMVEVTTGLGKFYQKVCKQ
jgi:hypothetical protein